MMIPCHATFESSGSNQDLECNAFCAKVLRNKNLALALDIKRDGAPPTGYYDASLCEFYLENPGWCRQMEDALIRFVKDQAKVFYFKPMRTQFRRFLHRYAIHFNLATEAVDAEPARSVVMRKTLGDCRIPPLLLSKTARNPALNKAPIEQVKAVPKHPINGLYLSNIVSGLSKLELETALAPVMRLGEDNIPFVSAWTDENDAVITPLISECVSMDEKELIIWQLKRLVKTALEDSIMDRIDCCWISQKGKVLWTEKKHLPQEQQQQAKNNGNQFNALKDASSSSSSCSGSDNDDDDNDDGWLSVGQANPYKPVAKLQNDAWKEPPAKSHSNKSPIQKLPADDKMPQSIEMTADDWEDLA
jgi:transcriptional repressor NF-X1